MDTVLSRLASVNGSIDQTRMPVLRRFDRPVEADPVPSVDLARYAHTPKRFALRLHFD